MLKCFPGLGVADVVLNAQTKNGSVLFYLCWTPFYIIIGSEERYLPHFSIAGHIMYAHDFYGSIY